MIYKNKDIKTNIDNETTEVSNPNTFFYTEDKGTASLRLFINWQNKPVNLNKTTMKPSLDLFHSDGSIWLNEALEVIMAEKGMVQYNIPSNVIKHAGNVSAKLFLKNENESVHVANFGFVIKDSGVEGAIEKEINVNLVDDAIKRIIDEQPELFKGDKGDKLTFEDLTPENKKELKGDKGDKGDTVLAPPKIYTRDEYNQLATKDNNTLYFISEV